MSPSAITRDVVDGLEAVVLEAGPLRAAFVPAAGLVGASLRHEGRELLGQRSGARAYAERGATMGIPFLHPWANRLDGDAYAVAGRPVDVRDAGRLVPRDPNGLPIHGLLPDAWEVVRADAAGDGAHLEAELGFSDDRARLAAFPFRHRVTQRVRLEPDGLRIDTALRPEADVPVPVSFGFHPYLSLPGVPRAEWHVELPARCRLVGDRRQIPTGRETEEAPLSGPLGSRTFDDGYEDLGPEPTFALAGGGRRIEVRFVEGYPLAQVYAPGDDDVVCFEPMTAPTNALQSGRELRLVEPGDTFRAAFEIRVRAEPAAGSR